MFKTYKVLTVILAVCIALGTVIIPIYAQETNLNSPSLSAQGAVLMEADNGATVLEKNAHTRLPMASTTKIMTALVALEMASPDAVIQIDSMAIGTEGSSIYLCEGEALTLEQLLYALMLESANDAAVAIAIGVAGSLESFVDMMNAKAISLGLRDTHFANPHGLDAEAHYTTAYELAVLARAALQNPLFKTIVSTRKTTIPHSGTDGVRLLVNHNKMLRLYDGCIGVKTGYTQKSGRCLVSAAERDGVTMIAVTIDSPDDWNDHTKLLDYGFSLYHSVELCPADFELCVPVVGSKDTYVLLSVAQETSVTLPRDVGVIDQTVECPRYLFAPIKDGDICGRMLFFADTNSDGMKEVVGEIPLTAQYSVQKHSQKVSVWKRFWQWFKGLFSHKS